MEFKVQEKLTTKKIEYDLKKQYNRKSLIGGVILVCFTALYLLIVLFVESEQPIKYEGASLYVLIAFQIVCMFLYLVVLYMCVCPIYMRFIGYKIGIDRYLGLVIRKRWLTQKRNRRRVEYFFKFARHGKYHLAFEQWYYTWSENYKTQGYDLEDSFRIDERVFVVLIGKKICYVYNDKMFDLSETLMRERLIDDVELHRQYKQAEQEEQQ